MLENTYTPDDLEVLTQAGGVPADEMEEETIPEEVRAVIDKKLANIEDYEEAQETGNPLRDGRVLPAEILTLLQKNIPPACIITSTTREGKEYQWVPAPVLKYLAQKYFGDRWSTEITTMEILDQERRFVTKVDGDGKTIGGGEMFVATVMVKVRSTVRGDGDASFYHESHAAASGSAFISNPAYKAIAINKAVKSAATNAIKTCLELTGFGFIANKESRDLIKTVRIQQAQADKMRQDEEADKARRKNKTEQEKASAEKAAESDPFQGDMDDPTVDDQPSSTKTQPAARRADDQLRAKTDKAGTTTSSVSNPPADKPKRKRGRPPGSKNKPKTGAANKTADDKAPDSSIEEDAIPHHDVPQSAIDGKGPKNGTQSNPEAGPQADTGAGKGKETALALRPPAGTRWSNDAIDKWVHQFKEALSFVEGGPQIADIKEANEATIDKLPAAAQEEIHKAVRAQIRKTLI